jgi:hypothetical protein
VLICEEILSDIQKPMIRPMLFVSLIKIYFTIVTLENGKKKLHKQKALSTVNKSQKNKLSIQRKTPKTTKHT